MEGKKWVGQRDECWQFLPLELEGVANDGRVFALPSATVMGLCIKTTAKKPTCCLNTAVCSEQRKGEEEIITICLSEAMELFLKWNQFNQTGFSLEMDGLGWIFHGWSIYYLCAERKEGHLSGVKENIYLWLCLWSPHSLQRTRYVI